MSGTSTISDASLRSALIDCAARGTLKSLLASCDARLLDWLMHHWPLFARPDQLPPDNDPLRDDWTVWLVLGGRGAGKTRTGAEWVRGMALGHPPFTSAPAGRIALVGETAADVRDVMIEGVSGLLAIHSRRERPTWTPTRRRLEWPNGAVAQAFSAEDPEQLRGPQFEAAWIDELCKWRHAQETWDMLQFGLRLGTRPRQVVTTTPRPIPLLKKLMADPRTALSRAATRANAFHLAPAFLDTIVGRYAGTRLGRQELDGEIVEERADALWNRDAIEAGRVERAPALTRIVVAVDPPASSGRRADACGIVAAGIDAGGQAFVLEDATLERARPAEWAAAAVALYRRLEADALVAEVNQGGEMVAAVIREIDPGVPVTAVRATRGKYLRAEPVAALYEQGRVRHVGALPVLEDEMADFGPAGLSSGRSPDRLDALVWAVTALALTGQAEPRVRRL
ncbi:MULTISPECIES: terminase family protein [unclassified Chelatococcus]|uniref:DNA-packaging protein n=1 Tax=unclassified Chelatococcus TaxID=2638111 RepID=UPI0020BF5DA8|nr:MULTISPECIES: terminase family protein [unclassified Chelatococcus]MCO5076132.1 terminase family protein [Chelatococcus sp.]